MLSQQVVQANSRLKTVNPIYSAEIMSEQTVDKANLDDLIKNLQTQLNMPVFAIQGTQDVVSASSGAQIAVYLLPTADHSKIGRFHWMQQDNIKLAVRRFSAAAVENDLLLIQIFAAAPGAQTVVSLDDGRSFIVKVDDRPAQTNMPMGDIQDPMYQIGFFTGTQAQITQCSADPAQCGIEIPETATPAYIRAMGAIPNVDHEREVKEAYENGRQACINDPLSCGMRTIAVVATQQEPCSTNILRSTDAYKSLTFWSYPVNDLFAERSLVRYNISDSKLTPLAKTPVNIQQMTLSVDGSQVAFIASNKLYVMTLDNPQPVQATDLYVSDSPPAWSPNGQWLAFSAYPADPGASLIDPNQEEIYLTSPDTGELLRLTDNESSDRNPVWSPDAQSATSGQMAFISREQSGITNLYVANLRNQLITRLTDGGYEVSNPVWSPDGKELAYLYQVSSGDVVVSGPKRGGDLYVVDGDGGSPRQITIKVPAFAPTWSPDGRQIAFATQPTGRADDPGAGVYIVQTDGSCIQQIQPNVMTHLYYPVWSPNGSQIAILATARQDIAERDQIMTTISLINIDGSKRQKLITAEAGMSFGLPIWTP